MAAAAAALHNEVSSETQQLRVADSLIGSAELQFRVPENLVDRFLLIAPMNYLNHHPMLSY
jgi:hypothetical protein